METVNLDLLDYKEKVGRLISDEEKYPTINEAVKLATFFGTAVEVLISLGLVMEACFRENMPIIECAKHVEAVCKLAKANAKMATSIMFLDGDEKVH